MYVNVRPPEYDCHQRLLEVGCHASTPLARSTNCLSLQRVEVGSNLCCSPTALWERRKKILYISALIGAIEEQMFGNVADVPVSSAARGYMQELARAGSLWTPVRATSNAACACRLRAPVCAFRLCECGRSPPACPSPLQRVIQPLLAASNPVCPGEIEGSGTAAAHPGAPQTQSPAFHRHLTGLCACSTRQNAAGGINLIQGPTQMERG